ncbi:hypothetical protein KDN34_15520 [Shewanella yunxiaonensis]|uniref:DUF6701 domain-containing protein n=1 Tax=Shewanella yunxiaonensis TaxID=2829809 RepID=A0ABX7YTX7_9GAMM|nr:DUF6701 domain-containing protein [Shewanella yunxiaonensis]QUN05576.1 hypothetical protein KDN34_15520 [Shewanella yunxiaonensis]
MLLFVHFTAAADVPYCYDIFTDPPTGSHDPNGLYPPASLGSSLGDLNCSKSAHCAFTPGDYNYANGSVTGNGSSDDQLSVSGISTRLYFDNLSLRNANLNTIGSGANLIIYIRHNLDIQGDSHINGILYLAPGATVNGSFKLDGAIAAGGILDPKGNSITVDLSVVDQADFGGMCIKQRTDTIDHFELHYASSPLVCAPETITVYVCKDSSCSSYYSGTINASVSPTAVSNGYWVGGNGLSFTDGVATIQLKKNDTAPITIGIADSTPTATDNTLCVAGSGTATTAACTMSFAEAGLVFDVPDKLAAKPATVLISAVKKDDSSQQCIPAFVGSKAIRFWSDYINPSSFSGYTPQPMTVNNQTVATSSTAASSQTLTFNSSGQATVNVDYADAGKMQLNAQYLGSGDDAGMDVSGADEFVSFPVGLCVTPQESNAECTNADYATCAAYKKAGASFPLIVTAKAWQSDGDTDICDNADTPSFAMANVSLGHQLVAPTAGLPGSLGVSSYDQHVGTAGTLVNQSVSEVGVFSFSAYSDQAYLGSNAFVLAPAYSVAIGRFYPAAFELTSVAMSNSCGSFSYMDQPFSLSFTLTALNSAGTKTSNYIDAFAKGVPVLHAENNDDGVDLSGRLSSLSTSWQLGSLTYAGTPTFARTTAPGVDGPFSHLILGVDVSDSDSVPMLSPDMNATSAGDCQTAADCVSQQLGPLDMRHGRIVVANTYGPENQTLSMTGQSQYWNGSNWQQNTNDSCSTVTPTLVTQSDNAALGYVFDPALSSGQSISRGGDASVSGGQFELLWQANGAYRGKVTAPLPVPEWLQWYWSWNGVNSELLDPRSSAYFGRYRGNDRIINWREVR